MLPNARLVTVAGAAHQVFAEFPQIVMPAVREFLAGVWPSAAETIATDPRIEAAAP